jgi:hypothetical protein
MKPTFVRFSGIYAVLAGLAGLLYSLAFIVLKSNLLSALFLMLGAFFASAALVALYELLRETDAPFALWGFLLALVGALGSLIHAGFDLAHAIHPPAVLNADLPSSVDPRGLATFGMAGIGLFVMSWLIVRSRKLPVEFGYLGLVSALLMVILYVGRLIILDANSLVIIIPALLEGFAINPVWYIWLGAILLRLRPDEQVAA